MDKKLTLKVTQTDAFSDFLKRFTSIDSSLLLEFGTSSVKAKSHTPERSVVKYCEISLDEIFSTHDITENFKVGLFNIDKLKQSFKYFSGSDFNFIIDLQRLDDQWVGTQITLNNSSLEVRFDCASMTLFTFIEDSVFNKISDYSNPKAKFLLQKEQQSKITSLFGIDSDYSKLTFEFANGKVFAKGKNFKYEVLDESGVDGKVSLSVFKHHYSFLDNETCEVYVLESKLVLKSSESSTLLVIGESE